MMFKIRGVLMSAIFVAKVAAAPPASMPALPERILVPVEIHPSEVIRPISPHFLGTNVTQYATDKKLAKNPETLGLVKRLGMTTFRFPNGCFADLYNWQSPKPEEMTVDEFLDFCDAVSAEPYYTFNMQGGTEGREGAPPAGAPLDEVIKYRHTAPNPCGYTNYYFGTLPEALDLFKKYTIERALAGKTPILHYELGNENWGQSRTDWVPAVYGKNAEAWCEAIRSAWTDAQKEHEKLKGLRIWIVAVGFPTMGNNQDPLKAPDMEVNRAWTAEINRLAERKLIDAATEHCYPFPANVGDSLYWTVHNLHNILALRAGEPNDRLAGYRDAKLAYRVPIEITEWNMKCWGRNTVAYDIKWTEGAGGFEKGLADWKLEGTPESARVVTSPVRRGKSAARLASGPQGEPVTMRHTLSLAGLPKSVAAGAYLWVRTPNPSQFHVELTDPKLPAGGKSKGTTHRVATQTNMWERLLLSIEPVEGSTEVDLTIRLEGLRAVAFVDEVQPVRWLTFADNIPPAATHYEQQLFTVDAIREMLHWPITRTHWHHLFGSYPCPQIDAAGKMRDNAVAFELLARRIGDQLVRTTCASPTFAFDTHADAFATDFNGVTPDTTGIPALSAVTTRRGDRLFVLLINRTTDRKIRAPLVVHGASVAPGGQVVEMRGEGLEFPGARLTARSLAKDLSVHEIPPLAAQVIELRIER